MTLRAALLATTAAAGLLAARALDGFGLLPGVTESAELRETVLDPRLTALGLVGCVVVGLVAARLRKALAVAALVGGQVGLVVALEELGRELTGAPPPAGGETGLWVAAGVQVVLALVAVTTVLLLVVPVRLLAPEVGTGTDVARLPSYRGVVPRVGRTGTWERGPPRGPALATPSS